MSLTISEYIERLSEYPSNYNAEAYEGEDSGLRIDDKEGNQVGFISDN